MSSQIEASSQLKFNGAVNCNSQNISGLGFLATNVTTSTITNNVTTTLAITSSSVNIAYSGVTAPAAITSITGTTADGSILILRNSDTTLVQEFTASSGLNDSFTLMPGKAVILIYRSGSTKWFLMEYVNSDFYNLTTVTSASQTLNLKYSMWRMDATSNAITATLPATSSTNIGYIFIIKKVDISGNAITINPNHVSQTIDGSTSVSLSSAYQSITIVNNGTTWDTIKGV